MPTDNVYLNGQVKWAQIKEPNAWDAWSLTIYPDGPSLEKIRDMQAKGLKNVLKKDEEGYFVGFRRPTKAAIRGKMVVFPPPVVLDSDGKTPLTKTVGTGSKVTVKLECYTHGTPGGGKAIACRLAGCTVNELVEGYSGAEPVNEPLYT